MKKLVIIAILLLASCAEPYTAVDDTFARKQATDLLNSLVGRSADELIQSAGPPASTYTTATATYLTYSASRTSIIPGIDPTYHTQIINNDIYTNSYGGTPPMAFNFSCRTTFTIKSNIVYTWRQEGNACQAISAQAKTYNQMEAFKQVLQTNTEAINQDVRAAYCYGRLLAMAKKMRSPDVTIVYQLKNFLLTRFGDLENSKFPTNLKKEIAQGKTDFLTATPLTQCFSRCDNLTIESEHASCLNKCLSFTGEDDMRVINFNCSGDPTPLPK